MAITIQELLRITVERDASDLHITTQVPPRIRIDGSLVTLDYPPLSPAETKTLAYSLLTDRQKKQFEEKLELDFSFGIIISSTPKVIPVRVAYLKPMSFIRSTSVAVASGPSRSNASATSVFTLPLSSGSPGS